MSTIYQFIVNQQFEMYKIKLKKFVQALTLVT